jgi:AraC-like DNA-binding protein/quercetin dioxygenase-like cupin family protein
MSQKCQSLLLDRRGRQTAQLATSAQDFAGEHLIAEHFHPEDQLIFALQGVMTVRTKQGTWVVPPLRAVWIPAGTPHSAAILGPVSMRTLYFAPQLVQTEAAKCFVLNVSPLLRELILHACKFPKLKKEEPIQRRVIEMIVDQLDAIRSIPLQLPHPTDARAMRIVQALVAEPGKQRTLAALCADCGASKRTIERLFIAETKMTFSQWRRQFRLLHAAMQLLASGAKVTRAALDAGCRSASAFIMMFRRPLGQTPTRYFTT